MEYTEDTDNIDDIVEMFVMVKDFLVDSIKTTDLQ